MEKRNNFNILRLIFASSVIISHSYPLTGNPEFFLELTNNQIELGALCVDIFFIISGYLIFKSLVYSKSIISYLWKRILRLFPALLVVLIITIIIVLFINDSNNILKQKDFYSYLPNNLSLYRVQFFINGVFENNPEKGINNSLWSLCYEFTMYLLVIPFFWIKNKKNSIVLLLMIFIILVYSHLYRPHFLKNIMSYILLDSTLFYRLAVCFFSGVLLTFVNLDKVKNNINIILLTSILIVSIYFNVYKYFAIIFLPLVVLLIGFSFNKPLWLFTEKIGDLSYGIYIYGYLIQQILMNYFDFNPIELMMYSLILTIIPAYFSWHLVENKVLKFKNYI